MRGIMKITVVGLALAIGCSKPQPKLGEEVQTASAPGVEIETREERHLSDSGKISGESSALVEVTATVAKIDQAKRKLTMQLETGEQKTFTAGPEIRNFKQIKKGDKVSVQYMVSVAFEARKPTAEELAAAEKAMVVAGRSKLGEKPAGAAAAETLKVVTVQSVDKKNQLVVLKDTTGVSSVVKAKYPENLEFINSGDQIVVTLTEAVLAQVTPKM